MPHITLLLHNIRSTHNVGSIFRTAEGLGVEVEVERNLITLTGRALALAILNQKGFVSHSEVVATVPPPAVWDRF